MGAPPPLPSFTQQSGGAKYFLRSGGASSAAGGVKVTEAAAPASMSGIPMMMGEQPLRSLAGVGGSASRMCTRAQSRVLFHRSARINAAGDPDGGGMLLGGSGSGACTC